VLKRALFLLALLVPAYTLAQNAPAPTSKPAAAKSEAKPAAKTAKPAAKPAKTPAKTADKPAAADAVANSNKVLIKTSLGDITVELYPDKSPKSVENFLGYVKSGFYDGTVFHRVIEGFMVQGGGFTKDLRQKPTKAPIPIESKNGLSNLRGTVSMARTMDPNSATAQFFINTVDNPRLDYVSDANPGYAVFGKVIAGLEVVDKIKAVPTGPQGPFRSDVPTTAIVIEKVSLVP
jgi:peptidyl-prolyl cis-trans isomerase A (cyclophilin A)/peptidyl-prolyl cis-trans isomerase B (cyclophilin B)